MSHFACIGLAADTAEQFNDTVTRCCAAASPHPDHLEWRDASGASLVVHLEDNEITCVTPFFAAKELTRWRVTTRGAQIDPCVHCSGAACDVLDASGAMLTRAFIQWRRSRGETATESRFVSRSSSSCPRACSRSRWRPWRC